MFYYMFQLTYRSILYNHPWPSGLGRGTPWPCLKLRCVGGREFNPLPGQYSSTVEPLTNDHPHQRPSLSYDHISCDGQWFLSRATIPLIRPHQCDSEGGRIRGVLLYEFIIRSGDWYGFVIWTCLSFQILNLFYLWGLFIASEEV